MTPPHAHTPTPAEYADMMRHYIPRLPLPAIREAWKHHATPSEVMRAMNTHGPDGRKGEQ